MKTILNKAFALLLLLSSNCFAATYLIPVGTELNHANADHVGSIAWYMATYGPNNTYALTSNATYPIRNTLYVPDNSLLGAATGVTPIISCDVANWVSEGSNWMIDLTGDYCRIHNIHVYGWFTPYHLVYAGSGATDPEIIGCTITSSKRVTGAHLIMCAYTDGAYIKDNLLRRAGCDKDELNFARESSIINLAHSTNALVDENDIAYAASSGVTCAAASHIDVTANLIQYTGQALQAGYISDGITSYHNLQGTTNRDVWITGNDIRYSYNNGIHVSGHDVHVNYNTIRNSGLGTSYGSNISLSDWRTPNDCTSNCTVSNNSLLTAPALGAASIFLDLYEPGTITISGNTGYTDVHYGATCSD